MPTWWRLHHGRQCVLPNIASRTAQANDAAVAAESLHAVTVKLDRQILDVGNHSSGTSNFVEPVARTCGATTPNSISSLHVADRVGYPVPGDIRGQQKRPRRHSGRLWGDQGRWQEKCRFWLPAISDWPDGKLALLYDSIR
jgi:hypothetical protein